MQQPILDALRANDAAAALVAARAMVAEQPLEPMGHRLLAASLRLDGDRSAALEAIDRAIELAPEEPVLHLERAGLLLQERQLDEAQAAFARTTGLDPNQFPAYIGQAQLALGRGDLDEVDRLIRTAARIAPDHPHVAAVEGTLALRRNDPDRALGILAQASEKAPDEPMLRHALGFAYMAKGHHAFAEQAFRALLQTSPGSVPLRALIADIVRRQGRPGEAADELAPLLDGDSASPALERLVGELHLEAGRPEQAQPLLRSALGAEPGNRRTLLALVQAWTRLEAADDARSTLDAALATHTQSADLWRARLLFEEFAGDTARDIIERWQAAMPEHVPALEAMVAIHDHNGQPEEAEKIARRIVEMEPGHTQAELRLITGLLASDPQAAVARVNELLDQATDPNIKRHLRQLLGRTQDAAGDFAAAAANWTELHADIVDQRLPLPSLSDGQPATGKWPVLAERDPATASQLLLWGPPGSMVERITTVFQQAQMPLLIDRFSGRPPTDMFQRYDSISELASGGVDTAVLAAKWREGLQQRSGRDGTLLDWLLFWDNAFLYVLREHVPEGTLLMAVRDPRDMLLDWLAYGGPAPLALPSPVEGARWLAKVVGQMADLDEQDLYPHRLARLDDLIGDPQALTQMVAHTLQVDMPIPPATAFGPEHFPAGHWRKYSGVLGDAFAELAAVAKRLGYPEA